MLTAGTKLKGQSEMSEIGHDGSKTVNILIGAGDLFFFNIGIAERGNVDIKGYIIIPEKVARNLARELAHPILPLAAIGNCIQYYLQYSAMS